MGIARVIRNTSRLHSIEAGPDHKHGRPRLCIASVGRGLAKTSATLIVMVLLDLEQYLYKSDAQTTGPSVSRREHCACPEAVCVRWDTYRCPCLPAERRRGGDAEPFPDAVLLLDVSVRRYCGPFGAVLRSLPLVAVFCAFICRRRQGPRHPEARTRR